MTQSHATIIASEAHHLFRALLRPEDLKAWWGCAAVLEARVGGSWVGGWGAGAGELGHQTVLVGQISRLEPDRVVAFFIAGAEIAFFFEPDAQGTKTTLAITAERPEDEAAVLQSWVDTVGNLKQWAEQHHRFTAPPPAARPAAPAPTVAPAPAAKPAAPAPAAKPAAPAHAGGGDPFSAAIAASQGEAHVLDDGGFGITDPHAVVKSWSKEQGFGYVTHPQLGDVVFDYDGCDFEPKPGDQVLLLVLAKRYDGKPKVKRIACPAKGSNIKA